MMGGQQRGAHVDEEPVVVEVSQLHLADAPKRRFGEKTGNSFRGRHKSTLGDHAVFKGKWRWDPVKGEFVERENDR